MVQYLRTVLGDESKSNNPLKLHYYWGSFLEERGLEARRRCCTCTRTVQYFQGAVVLDRKYTVNLGSISNAPYIFDQNLCTIFLFLKG